MGTIGDQETAISSGFNVYSNALVEPERNAENESEPPTRVDDQQPPEWMQAQLGEMDQMETQLKVGVPVRELGFWVRVHGYNPGRRIVVA